MELNVLIRELGGNVAVARALGATPNQVCMWKQRGSVPGRFLIPMWELATSAGHAWTPPGAEKSLTIARAA